MVLPKKASMHSNSLSTTLSRGRKPHWLLQQFLKSDTGVFNGAGGGQKYPVTKLLCCCASNEALLCGMFECTVC